MTLASLCPLLVVLAAGTSGSRRAPTPTESRLQAAQQEFNRGNFDQALKDLESAPAEANDSQQLARIHLLRAQAYAAKQDFVSAEGALADALEFDPAVTLDPSRVDPGLVRVLDGLRGRLRGELKVSADKPQVHVRFDGVDLGEAPVRADVAIGRHTLEARSVDGHFEAKQQVVVHPRTSTQVSLLMVETTPVMAEDKNAPKQDRPLWPFAEVRLDIDPTDAGNQTGFGLGAGLKSRYLRVSMLVRLFQEFGLQLRGAVTVPVIDHLDAYASLECPVDFGAVVRVALGGSGGAEYMASPWLGVFAEIGARHYFTGSSVDNRFILQAGVRLWLP